MEAYERSDILQFEHFYKAVGYQPQCEQYQLIYDKLIYKLKQEKLRVLLKSYSKVRLDFLGRRLSVSIMMVEQMIYGLIVDEQIAGRIAEDSQGKYLILLEKRDAFLTIQE